MADNVVHFAIHADDVERSRRFYESVFGWRFEAWGPPGFYNVDTGSDEHPGIHGALHVRGDPPARSSLSPRGGPQRRSPHRRIACPDDG